MKSREAKKICPIRYSGSGLGVSCLGEDCAWWQEYAKECAVPLMAGILADSTICQNVWEVERKDADM